MSAYVMDLEFSFNPRHSNPSTQCKKALLTTPPLYTAPVGLSQNRTTQDKLANPTPRHFIYNVFRRDAQSPRCY